MKMPEKLSFRWVHASGLPEDYAKFLGIVSEDGTGIIYAGNFEYHLDLVEAVKLSKEYVTAHLFAAGEFLDDAIVRGWSSFYFEFWTPESAQEPVASFILDNLDEIVREWGERKSTS